MPDAHQAFVKRRLSCQRRDHRLERQQNAPFVQRVHDLVGRSHVLPSQRFALDVRTIDLTRARPPGFGAFERLLRTRHDFLYVRTVARRGDAADGYGERYRAC